MSRILVSGLVNMETTLQVEEFPIAYSPGRFPFHGVRSRVSGVGFNVTKALSTLGDEVNLVTLIGNDPVGEMVEGTFLKEGLSGRFIQRLLEETPQTVVLYDRSGQRQLNTDLKDIQEKEVPEGIFMDALEGCDTAVLCNINFSRKYLNRVKAMGKRIATDVHTLSLLDDEYNRDFMEAADILFMSHEALPCTAENWARQILGAYGNEIIVIGLGKEGSLLSVKSDSFLERIPACFTRTVQNTVGAGDAFFSAFVHFYTRDGNPYEAVRKATVFASYKIGERTASEGFLSETELTRLYQEILKKSRP